MSLIRAVVESIAKTLNSNDYFRTSPRIPVLVEDSKDIEREITAAINSTGAFVLCSFAGSTIASPDIPGPYMTEAKFTALVSEIPSVWRNASSLAPSGAEIAEAVSRILHHHQPLDDNEQPLIGGVLVVESIDPKANDSFSQHAVTLKTEIGLPNTQPTRPVSKRL